MNRETLVEAMVDAVMKANGFYILHQDTPDVSDDTIERFEDAEISIRQDCVTAIAAIEAAGVRLVPSETTEAMSDAFYHALNHGYPDHRKDRQSNNQGWTMQSEFMWQAFLAASPYAKDNGNG